MGVRPEYLAQLDIMMTEWERDIWPIMEKHGIGRDMAWLSYTAIRVEMSVQGGPPEPKESWQ